MGVMKRYLLVCVVGGEERMIKMIPWLEKVGRLMTALRVINPKRNLGSPQKMALMSEVNILWQVKRLLLVLPVTFSPTGLIRFSWRSRPLRVTVLGWLVMSTYMVVAMTAVASRRFAELAGRKLDMVEVAPLLVVIGFTTFAVVIPAAVLRSVAAFCRLSAEWDRVERLYRGLTGSALRLGIEAMSPFIVLTTGYMFFVVMSLSDTLEIATWELPPLAHTVYCLWSMTYGWVCCNLAVAATARGLAGRLQDDCCRLGARGVRLHRLLWLQSVKLLHVTCDCYGNVNLVYLFYMYVLCVAFVFTYINAVFLDSGHSLQRFLGLSLIALTFGVNLLFMCLAPQMAIDAIQEPVRRLLRLPVWHQTRAFRAEVFYFLHDVSNADTTVSFFGLTDLSRSRLVKMFATGTTYIVVMSQLASLL